jgi:1,4-alpha-glucan branching enzyme
MESFPPQQILLPLEGSWGAHGDFHMWLNEGTRWTWERLWPLEDAFWTVAASALESAESRYLLAHAARQLLLAQSSDWQFMISTGAVPDYGEKRFKLHCDDADLLIRALRPDASGAALAAAREKAAELESRDNLFPDVLDSVERVVGRG